MYPHLVGSTFFFSLCRCHNIWFFLMCIIVFVSVGLVSRRELGGMLCTTISLDILLYSLPQGGQVREFCHVEARVIDVPRGKKHYISAD